MLIMPAKIIQKNITLPIGFTTIILLMIIVSAVALIRIADINRGMENIVKDYNVKSGLIITMYTAARERSVVLLTMMTMEDAFDREEQFDRFNALATEFSVARLAFNEMATDDKEKTLLEGQLKRIRVSVPLQTKVIDFLGMEDHGRATSTLINESITAQNKVLEQLRQMLEYQQEKAERSLQDSDETYRSSALFIVGLAVIAILVSVGIARMVVNKTREAERGLRQSKDLLEQRVQERTEELEKQAVELKHIRDDAIRANQHKSEFLANMSHELRTPLNAVIGFSEVLKEKMFGELNEKQDEYVQDIHSSGHHLLSLINDILDLSKIEAGRMEINLTRFDLPSALENSFSLIKERTARHGIEFESHIDDQLGDFDGDERKIKQIMLNLLSNAIKFTPEGGQISVRALKEPGHVKIMVKDTGVGIAPDDQNRIFEEFQQVGTDTDSKNEGTGLGLTLTKTFVEMHDGTLSVESEPGKGSTFTFTLPFAS